MRLASERREDDGAGHVVLLVDEASADDAQALQEQLGPRFSVVPDPDGALAAAVGVGFWPTTLTVDSAGNVTAWKLGAPAEEGEHQ